MTLISPFRLPIRKQFYLCLLSFATVLLVSNHYGCRVKVDLGEMVRQNPVQYVSDGQNSYPYHRNMPLLFIGGMPRSGTTLMRVMLDAHPEIRCGEETRVVPRMLGLKTYWTRSRREYNRMYAAGVDENVLTSAVAEFILEIMAKHAEPAPRLCNKDPFNLRSAVDLLQMFPNCKFILMVRDGRAVVHSIVSREVTISGFDITSYSDCLQKWNAAIESMYMQCVSVGFERCMPVYYEQLVLHPEAMMRKILAFLDVPWDDSVLHHEQHINKPGGASLSSVEKSTDQVVKPVNLDALTAWAKHFPTELRYSVRYLAPMLVRLGYDPDAYPPNYGRADSFVANNTFSVRNNKQYWLQQAMAALHMSKVKEPTIEDEELGSDSVQQRPTPAPRGGTVAFRPQTLPIIVPQTSQTQAMETLASQWSSVNNRTAASTTTGLPPDQR